MNIPTGPAIIIGLELNVLPCRAEMAQKDGRRCAMITAPTCRYGTAVYVAVARCPRHTRNRRTHRATSRSVVSGRSVLISVPEVWSEVEVLLHLKGIDLYPGALIDATLEELTAALEHPFREVRERAIFDMAEKATFEVADAVKHAYRRELREKRRDGE